MYGWTTGCASCKEGRLGDHGIRHAEGPVLARVGVPVRAHGAALDLVDNGAGDEDVDDDGGDNGDDSEGDYVGDVDGDVGATMVTTMR